MTRRLGCFGLRVRPPRRFSLSRKAVVMRLALRPSVVRACANRPARLLLSALALLTVASMRPAAPQPQVPPTTASGRDAVTMLPEVRLRKLHLVRPDLIPYPISYEVYC